jgi:malate/lactate dehydrogenase
MVKPIARPDHRWQIEPSTLAATCHRITNTCWRVAATARRFKEEFVTVVQQRGEAVIKARKQSSSLSAASAACNHMRDWILGTPKVQDMLPTPHPSKLTSLSLS